MKAPSSQPVECNLLAAYVDDASPAAPAGSPTRPAGKVVRARLIGSFIDHADSGPAAGLPLCEFVVLTLDNRSIAVRGHSIEAGPDSVRQVVVFGPRQKVCVAMFDGTKILGIYEGAATPA